VELAGKKILVVGLARTGGSLVRFLVRRGARVTVNDRASEETLGVRAEEVLKMGAAVRFGDHAPEAFACADLIVISPGVPHTLEALVRAAALGIEIIGEIELAARFIAEPIVAVTGTNGKTTTTHLLGTMLARSGRKVFVGGNIGVPLIEYAEAGERAEVVVAEVSSFQLDTIRTFRPRVGVLLNITPDHLDRYPDFAGYAAAKARLFENQSEEDTAVLNGADPTVRAIGRGLPGRRLFFNPAESEPGGAFSGGKLHLRPISGKSGISFPDAIDFSGFSLPGAHNLENAAAASLAALSAGGTPEGIAAAIREFKGLPHRIRLVAEIDGVRYFNDSKATTVESVRRALECFDTPVVLIMGGRNKGCDFAALREVVSAKVRTLILLGEAAGEIAETLSPPFFGAVLHAGGMEEAVSLARETAKPGDVALLSPACSSFDMFASYAHRGDVFESAVSRLAGGEK
jgi:UDP-N-acetylmuramoylalanine--D-glutamate ligase